ncbi:protein TIME FOR COFFEE isoform X2 [Hevea brasiliensis]|uniref:protein TIME FOR COFFEE isoform X2 n=1 Tax=Hevea brasiliensis TaxID=3981 RepID=UPI0025F3BDE7|nr:protein TIME FOR COFFEE isoform X2 [Hevea brasiliensis]
MDRSRETRRSKMVAFSGLSRRQHISTPHRDSPEDGHIELQESARLRDRDLLNRNKRRPGDGLVLGISREEAEETTEESACDEEDYEIDDGRVSRMLPPNATSSSSVLPSHSHRKSLPPTGVGLRQVPSLKVLDEMIGVSVPRKARSASVKRSHESWVSGNGGFGEDLKHRRASTSSVSRSAEASPPSSSDISVRKKMKLNGPKTRFSKVWKSTVHEDIEIEIAEVLYGLMKQSQGSKEENDAENSLQKLESKDANGAIHDSKSSLTPVSVQSSFFSQNSSPTTDPILASKKRKLEAESATFQNSSIASSVKDESEQPVKMELVSPKVEKISTYNVEPCEDSRNTGDSRAASKSPELQEEVIKQVDSKSAIEEPGVASDEKSVSPEEELASCTKLDVDFQDSTVKKAISNTSEVEGQRKETFKIDLMAPPPMVSSPERDGFIDLSSDPKHTSEDVEMKTENKVKNEEQVQESVKEAAVAEVKDKKIKVIGEKPKLKLDLEKLDHDCSNDDATKLQQKQPPKAAISKLETTVESSLAHLPVAVSSWPSGLPPFGYMPPFQTVVPMDGTTGSSTATQGQPPRFRLTQPRSKRCSTHHYIASNICLHQQFTKMNNFWQPAAGAATVHGTKPNNANAMSSMENMIIRNPLQGSFPVVNANTARDKGQVVANFPVLTRKDRNVEGANCIDTAQKKQLVLHQSPQPASAGNLMHGPPFIFSFTQHQAPVAATGIQTGPSKSAASVNNTSLSGNAIAGVPTNSSALPAVAAALRFSYPNLAENKASYLTILPNNGYSFPISTPIGIPPAITGGSSASALPFYNGSFYSSQMPYPSQLQQQQSHSQPLVQPVRQNASSLSGSSLSHKQLQTQQPRGTQVSGNNFLTSTTVQSQKQQKQHVLSHQPRKLENESGEASPTISDARALHSQKSVHGQIFMVPLQPNFTLMPSTTLGVSGAGNHGEKQQQHQSQDKGLKSGVDMVPSQAFALSFASFNGSNTPSNLNFSSMSQNPAILQNLPDMTCQEYQVVSASQSTQNKNHQVSEGKTGANAANPDDGKMAMVGKSPGIGQELNFDNSARTLNFASSPFTGNWPACPIISTTNSSVAVNSSNSQQHQLLQLQKQHILHQQQHRPNGAARSKTLMTNSLPSSSIGSKFSNNPILSESLAQSNSSPQNPQWANSPKTPTTQAPLTPLMVSNTPTLNVTQQQGRAPQGQISFGRNSKSNLAPQGQQMPSSNQSPLLVAGAPPIGILRTTSANAKGANSSVPVLQSQHGDNSLTGNGQKNSPVCGRNVPSILSACPSHLSELKY